MATPQTAEEVLKSDPFYSPDTNLDLSAFPWLTPLADTSVDDDKFAPLDTRGMGVGSSGLKEFLANPDRESVAELRDPETLRKFDEGHGGTTFHANGVAFQVYQRDGKWRAKGATPDGTLHRFTADTRDALFPKISRAVSENTVRDLTESEQLQVVRLAQGGDTSGAIVKYLEFAIGEKRGRGYADPNELLGDPALSEVFDAAAMLTWLAARPKVEDSDEFQEFLQRYRGGRPLNHDLLDGAYMAFEKQEYMTLLPRAAQKAEEPAIPARLDDLDDESVERLMSDTKRQFAREVRAGVR